MKQKFYNNIMDGLVIFITVITLFVIGSICGWVIELFFRRFVSQHKWVNPGFLVGPYLPIYGCGVLVLYGLSNINFGFSENITYLDIILKILMIGVIMTLIEFFTGLFFTKALKIKLWDYFKRPGNIMGLICPLFSFIWLICGALYHFFVNPYLVTAVTYLAALDHQIYYFFVGIIIGMMLVDACYSFHLATKIKEAAKKNKVVVSLDALRQSSQDRSLKRKEEAEIKINEIKSKIKKSFYFFPFKNNTDFIDELMDDCNKKEQAPEDEKKNK